MENTTWTYKSLSELCEINLGKTPSRSNDEYWGKGYSWVSIADLKEKYISNTKEQITDLALAKANCKVVKEGTLLMSFKLSIGKLAFADKDLYTNEAIVALPIKKTTELNNDYLYYVLKYIPLLGGNQAAMGKTLNKKSLSVLKIPLPRTLNDQKRIAKVLSDCEALIQKRKESIALLNDLLKSTFLEMFGDESKFKSMTVEEIASKERYSLSSGPFGSNLTSRHYSKTGIIILRGKNISSGKLDLSDIKYVSEEKAYELRRSAIKPDDIVIVAVGSSGSALRIPEILPYAIMSQNFNKITPNQELVLPVYLEFSINSEIVQRQFRRVMTDAGRTFLGLTKIKQIKIPVPEKDEQIKFEKIALKIGLIKEQAQLSLQELENLYGSLSQRAFKGELDLNKVIIPDMEDSKKKDLEEVKEDISEKELDELIDSFEHTLPEGEVPSNRGKDIRNLTIRKYLGFPEYDEATEGIEFSYMDKDFFYQFILKDGFASGFFTLQDVEQYARKYILRGTGYEFTYENWKTILFRFIGAKQPIIEQIFDEDSKTIKLKLTDEAFKI